MKKSSQRDWDHQIRLAAQCDVLAKIDPRLFQAAFDQAQAKKAQDEAQLIAAEKDSSAPRRWRRKITDRSNRST